MQPWTQFFLFMFLMIIGGDSYGADFAVIYSHRLIAREPSSHYLNGGNPCIRYHSSIAGKPSSRYLMRNAALAPEAQKNLSGFLSTKQEQEQERKNALILKRQTIEGMREKLAHDENLNLDDLKTMALVFKERNPELYDFINNYFNTTDHPLLEYRNFLNSVFRAQEISLNCEFLSRFHTFIEEYGEWINREEIKNQKVPVEPNPPS